MDEDILMSVTNIETRLLTIVPAAIEGYVQRNVIDEGFPVLVPAPADVTSGLLISGLNQPALDRVLFYEGDEYYLSEATVITTNNTRIPASVFHSTGIYATGSEVWDFKQWSRSDKAMFLPRVRRYMQLYGTMSATEADQYW